MTPFATIVAAVASRGARGTLRGTPRGDDAPNGAPMRRPGRKGQALVELGIVVTAVVLLTLGAVEFGYTFLALHLVTQATAAGARAASVLQVGHRDACGKIDDTAKASVTSLVTSQAGNVASGMTVKVDQYDSCPGSSPCGPSCTSMVDGGSAGTCSTATLPVVCVTVNGTIPSIFGLRKSSAFTRAQGFRDEGR